MFLKKLSWLFYPWMMNNKFGAYIHIPFCDHICYYCDFTKTIKNKYVNDYIQCLCKEILNFKYDFDSIYIGGGSPSCLTISEIKPLFDVLNNYKNIKEFTIELNPENITYEKIQFYHKNNVNRVSLGVQTTNDKLLKYIGRKHTYSDVINAVQIIKNSGINNFSLDLIYGFHNQTLIDIEKDVKTVLKLNPSHLSLYSLTIENNTPFGKRKEKRMDNELETNTYLWISDYLVSQGFNHYEVANFAKNGYESYHNLKYWNYEDYIGFGIGASSKIGNHRFTNTNQLKKYLNGDFELSESIYLNHDDLMFEKIMMGLRLEKGIKISNDIIKKYKFVIDKHVKLNNLSFENNILKTINNSRLYLHDILADFI